MPNTKTISILFSILLHRIIKASSKAGNVVFNPFCGWLQQGYGIAAQQLDRKWINIDIENSQLMY
jgi:DNA modification methylase